jgi:hypothetical protein
MSLMYPQKKSLWVLSQDFVGPIYQLSPADPLTRKSFVQSSAYNGTKMGWYTILLENEIINFSYYLREHKVL